MSSSPRNQGQTGSSVDDGDFDNLLGSKSPERKFGSEKKKRKFASSSKRNKAELQERAAQNKLHDGFFSDTEQISVALQQRKEDNKYGTLSKNRLKFDKDSPVVKGGSMTDLILWLIDFSGSFIAPL
jgi:hypothetical protein